MYLFSVIFRILNFIILALIVVAALVFFVLREPAIFIWPLLQTAYLAVVAFEGLVVLAKYEGELAEDALLLDKLALFFATISHMYFIYQLLIITDLQVTLSQRPVYLVLAILFAIVSWFLMIVSGENMAKSLKE